MVWKGASNERFSLSNGVRQGSVLSPILFYYYTDNLIKEIVRNNIGCKVGTVFTGTLVYADGLILLSSSKQGLSFFIDTCNRYAERHNLVFSSHGNSNKSKSKCMFFDKTVFNSRLVCML